MHAHSGKARHVKRFADRKDKRRLMAESKDFYPRRYSLSIKTIALLFASMLLLAVTLIVNAATKLLFLPPEAEFPIEAVAGLFVGSVVCFLIVAIIGLYLVMNVRQRLAETEFRNLIFASCMQVENSFCLVVHKERKGIYCDYDFSTLFSAPDHAADPFQQLLAISGMRQEDKNALFDALDQSCAACFEMPIVVPDGEEKRMALTLYPLTRPKGFFLLSGKELKDVTV